MRDWAHRDRDHRRRDHGHRGIVRVPLPELGRPRQTVLVALEVVFTSPTCRSSPPLCRQSAPAQPSHGLRLLNRPLQFRTPRSAEGSAPVIVREGHLGRPDGAPCGSCHCRVGCVGGRDRIGRRDVPAHGCTGAVSDGRRTASWSMVSEVPFAVTVHAVSRVGSARRDGRRRGGERLDVRRRHDLDGVCGGHRGVGQVGGRERVDAGRARDVGDARAVQ